MIHRNWFGFSHNDIEFLSHVDCLKTLVHTTFPIHIVWNRDITVISLRIIRLTLCLLFFFKNIIFGKVLNTIHARIQKVLPQRVQLWRFFIVDEGRKDPKYHYKRAIIGPLAKRHLNGVSLACRCVPNIECWLGSVVIFRGSGPVLLRNPTFLWFLRGGGPDALPPSGSVHAVRVSNSSDSDQAQRFVGCVLCPNCLQKSSAEMTLVYTQGHS